MDSIDQSRKKLALTLADLAENEIRRYSLEYGYVLGEIRSYADDEYPMCREHMIWMCREMDIRQETMSPTQMHRWVGFIQGYMATTIPGSTINKFRDEVRSLKGEFPE